MLTVGTKKRRRSRVRMPIMVSLECPPGVRGMKRKQRWGQRKATRRMMGEWVDDEDVV